MKDTATPKASTIHISVARSVHTGTNGFCYETIYKAALQCFINIHTYS